MQHFGYPYPNFGLGTRDDSGVPDYPKFPMQVPLFGVTKIITLKTQLKVSVQHCVKFEIDVLRKEALNVLYWSFI